MPALVAAAEHASESEDVIILNQAGYTGEPVTQGAGDLPAAIDDLLYQTTLMAPLSAVQQTHALIARSGESPARLGALVRGYANLGQLTSFQWSSIHKAMTARSLLYAQRLVVQNPESPLALYHRAYAFAMTGLHQAAIDDVTAAQELRSKLKDSGRPVELLPPWTQLILPLCRYEVSKLESLTGEDPRRAPLAALCCFLTVENGGSISRLMRIGQLALGSDPACFRIIDGMTQYAGVGAGHMLTEMPTPLMLRTLPADIKMLPVVPARVQAALTAAGQSADHIRNLANVSAAFVDAPEPAEPSYTLAGRIIQETSFVHVKRRTKFMADMWGVDCAAFVEESQPLVADHPLAPFIQAMTHPSDQRAARLAQLEVPDPQFQMRDLIYTVQSIPPTPGKMTGSNLSRRLLNDTDGTAYDLERVLHPTSLEANGGYEVDQARHFKTFSKFSGVATATLILKDWKNSQPHADQWAGDFKDQPAVLVALGTQYYASKQMDKSKATFEQCAKIAPDLSVFQKLAGLYLVDNDESKWEATLQRVKLQPDPGLDHAIVDFQIARHCMAKGEYEKARRFADASADESGAGWAMETAGWADEYCGDFAAAENQHHAATERYGGPEWFFWCKRTGKGDLVNATASVDAYVNKIVDQKQARSFQEVGVIYYLQGQAGKARSYLERAMKDGHEAWAGVMASTICLQQDDPQARIEDLKFVVDNCSTNAAGEDFSALVDFAKLELAAGDKSVAKEELGKLLDRVNDSQGANVVYFAARDEELTGQPDRAKKNYQFLITWNVPAKWAFVLGCDRLHQLGVSDTPIPKISAK